MQAVTARKDYANPFEIEDVINYSSGFSAGDNFSGSVSLRFPLVRITGSTGGNKQNSVNTSSIQFMDVTGDGLPDHMLHVIGQEKMQITENKLGKIGLLKEIKLAQGGSYKIEYEKV